MLGEPSMLRPNALRISVLFVSVALSACSNKDDGANGGTDPNDRFALARQQCVDKINQYRQSEGKPPYQRWSAEEACADGAARADSQSGQAHGAFGSCQEFAQ